MNWRRLWSAVCRACSSGIVLVGLWARTADAQTPTTILVAQVSQPVFVTAPPEDFQRAFIASKGGTIHLLSLPSHALSPNPFLVVPSVNNVGEQGLLGFAFHPGYAANGYVYVTYNRAPDGNTLVVRYTRSATDPNRADPDSAAIILRIDRPPGFHNAGWTAFGNDGYLYLSTGDRASPGMAQNLTLLHGKILRIDVDGDDFPADEEANYRIPPDNPIAPGGANRPEIWSWGFRNPWRCGFDRRTGGLFISDVGQQDWEELSYLPPGVGNLNFGWPCLEGHEPWMSVSGCAPPNPLAAPILVYGHNQLVEPTLFVGCAITGGEVYRGCALSALQGAYFFADFCTGAIFSMRFDGTTVSDVINRTAELQPSGGSISSPVSFGADAYGELYICDISGTVYKIVATGPPQPDCDSNGLIDTCEIAADPGLDLNQNGVPDGCESGCSGDVDGDGHTTLTDLSLLLATFGTCDGSPLFNPDADLQPDGCVNLSDLAVLLADFGC